MGPVRSKTAGRSRVGVRIAAVALLALVVGGNGPMAEARPSKVEAVTPDAYLYVPIDGGRAVARWNGSAAGYPLPKARALLPGRFDSKGGGVFVYRAGSAPDGVLRVRGSDDGVAVSLKKETVNGHFEPITGDFDGNGFTDIIWYQADGGPSYTWLFRADGSHASRPFPITIDPGYGRAIRPFDVNLDGITDLLVKGDTELWIMRADGTHTARKIALPQRPGFDALVTGNIGPDDGVTRRRAVAVYEGGYEHLLTFNAAGQSTGKQIRPHTGTCCVTQPAIGGHFRSGYATTLFFHAPSGRYTEYLQDITPGGNIVTTPAPQITNAYATAVADYDGNGFDDILLSNRTGATYLFSSDGSGFTKTDPADIPARSTVVAVPMS